MRYEMREASYCAGGPPIRQAGGPEILDIGANTLIYLTRFSWIDACAAPGLQKVANA